MRVLLISTYELGHQPLGLASPAAALTAAGHDVSTLDVAIDSIGSADIAGQDAIAISVPMHTAARLAQDVVRSVRDVDSEVPIALFGLYAGEGAMDEVAARFVGEYEPDLTAWVADGMPPVGTRISVTQQAFATPQRESLPDLSRYGRLRIAGEERVAGYVEASHGCRHRCRHCPIPAVYDGRYRIVSRESVLADVDAQVAMGALHLTWGDPDFLNGPRHAMDLLEEVHRRHPDVTHDLTIKVEHLRRHETLLDRLAAAGTLFVVSAFETTDDRTLALLDKGHTAEDMAWVVERARSAGIDVHPSWMPFVPWTVPSDVVGIFEFLAAHDLVGSTDPVQLSIRLLIPRHSLMLELDEVASVIGPYDEEALSYRWASLDPRSDELQRVLAERAESAVDDGASPVETFLQMWGDAVEADGGDRRSVSPPASITLGRPGLTESWFCCAEPTRAQTGGVAAP
ncbi:MAG: radical SAM protein [Acidimicrobiia bacterium]